MRATVPAALVGDPDAVRAGDDAGRTALAPERDHRGLDAAAPVDARHRPVPGVRHPQRTVRPRHAARAAPDADPLHDAGAAPPGLSCVTVPEDSLVAHTEPPPQASWVGWSSRRVVVVRQLHRIEAHDAAVIGAGDPHRAGRYADAARTVAGRNRLDHLVGGRRDPLERPVEGVGHPHAAGAHGHRRRPVPDGDRLRHRARARVDSRDGSGGLVGDPQRAGARGHLRGDEPTGMSASSACSPGSITATASASAVADRRLRPSATTQDHRRRARSPPGSPPAAATCRRRGRRRARAARARPRGGRRQRRLRRGDELARRTASDPRVLGQRAGDHGVEGDRQAGAALARARRVLLEVRVDRRHLRVAREGHRAGQHLEQHAPQRVDVGAAIGRLAARSAQARGSRRCRRAGRRPSTAAGRGVLGQPEVGEVDVLRRHPPSRSARCWA